MQCWRCRREWGCAAAAASPRAMAFAKALASGSAAEEAKEAVPRRRTRRANYADYDRIFNGSGSASIAAASPCATPFPGGRTRGASSFAARLSRRKLALQLSLLHTGYGVGRLMSCVANVGAYAAYVRGPVNAFVRLSSSEPLAAETLSSADGADDGGEERETSVGRHAEEAIEYGGCYAEAALLRDGLRSSSSPSSDGQSESRRRRRHRREGEEVHRGFLQHCALGCVYVGYSKIHSRGLFSAVDLPKGTRILREPRQVFMASPDFLVLFADTHQRLPDTLHYTHPTGSILELVMQPLPHHLLNHSCDANVCCGLSSSFWDAAAAAGSARLAERLTTWTSFEDPNSFFTTRDVRAGEELTLDYGYRMGPMVAGDGGVRERSQLLCRCGSPRCRHFVYQLPPEAARVVQRLHGRRGLGDGQRRESQCFEAAKALFGVGFDDEAAVLSLLPSHRPAVSYLHGDPTIPALRAASSRTATEKGSVAWEHRVLQKATFLRSYRYVLKHLNEVAPREPLRRGD